MADRPHIVIFNPDQWRGDVMGHLGDPAAVTPNLDALVQRDAVSFRHAYCQNPVCTPSRCSFMSGWYPHVRGHRTMFHMLHPERGDPMLLKTLRDEGYYVWWGGKNDVVPGQDGYDRFCDIKYKPGEELAPNLHAASQWRGEPGSDTYYSFFAGKLEAHPDGCDHYHDSDWAHVQGAVDFIHQASGDQPLCIYLPLQYPHPPYGVEEPWFSMIDRDALPQRVPTVTDWTGKPSLLPGLAEGMGLQDWDEDRWTELRATYYGMCARVDYQFGMIIAALREAGLYDDTALFFFSDHGDYTGDYGLVEKTENTFEDCLTRVPMVVKPPKDTPVQPGIRDARDALIELIDFPATVEALTGIAPEHTHFGRSLLPLIAGETTAHRDAVFTEGGRRHGEKQCMGLEHGSNPKNHYWPHLRLQQQDDGPEHTFAVMCRTARYKYVRRLHEADELYDLHEDPAELHNRIDDPALAAIRAELVERTLHFFMETADAVPLETDARA